VHIKIKKNKKNKKRKSQNNSSLAFLKIAVLFNPAYGALHVT